MALSISSLPRIISGSSQSLPGTPDGLTLRRFAAGDIGATGFSTGMATFQPGVQFPYHVHEVSEAITVLAGVAQVLIEGRSYELVPFDCAHVPAGLAHSVANNTRNTELFVHSAFASPAPKREFVHDYSSHSSKTCSLETITRFDGSDIYELAGGAFFRDLFARRLGASGICGGYGLFEPGASLPCHIHDYDESITIVSGEASCLVQGREYQLRGYDTAFVPRRRPHRFINRSSSAMAMIWIYAGDEPDREIIDKGYCSGALTWPN
jgi:putative monooxygenase